jgi:very-short-patch-repair endonuclease
MLDQPPNRTRLQRSDGLKQRARQLRQVMTPPERRLWEILRDRRLGGFKFRRQHPIGPYVADHYCSECGLVVELDGTSHESTGQQDTERTEYLESQGVKVVRVMNDDLLHHPDAVATLILRTCKARSGEPSPGRRAARGDLSSP